MISKRILKDVSRNKSNVLHVEIFIAKYIFGKNTWQNSELGLFRYPIKGNYIAYT